MTSPARLRWGILGVAKINERLVPAFHESTTADLLGIASRDGARAKQAAAEYQIPQAFDSYEALLASPDIDAVYNPLPNTLHDEWTRKAADAGKHILCEKPLCPTAAESLALVEYCRAKGVRLMDGFMWPHHPRTQRIRELIDSDTIGRVKRVTASFTFNLEMDADNIRLQPGKAGGSLLDVGCYTTFGIRWAFGEEPVKVFATAVEKFGVDVEMNGIFWFADGRMASFDCGFTAPLRMRVEITGTKGVIEIPDMWLPSPEAAFSVQADGQSPERHTVPGYNQIVCMLDDFAHAVRENRDPVPLVMEAVKGARVMDALARSAREGRVVEVEQG